MSRSKPQSATDLAKATNMSRHTIMRHCKALQEKGWVLIGGHTRRRALVGTISLGAQEKLAERAARDLELAHYKGEFLLKAILDYLIESTDYVENGRPSYLINPDTGQPMEYDRLYPGLLLAFERNGPQHYRTTKKFPSTSELKEQKKRDMYKRALSQDNQIRLIVLSGELTVASVLKTIPEDVPVVRPRPGPYLDMLEKQCRMYADLTKQM